MIVFITSMTVPFATLKEYCPTLPGVQLYPPPHMNEQQQKSYADLLLTAELNAIRMHVRSNQNVCSFDELVLLRLLRHVREGKLPKENLVVHCLDKDKMVHILTVNSHGEFMERFPEGFFEARGEELFG